MAVVLKPVSSENWYDCTQLKVTAEQLNVFPAPVVYWIAESKYMTEFELRAVYSEELLVGFVVFTLTPDEDDHYWIIAMMIDEQQQGKGYGRAAMQAIIQLMSTANCRKIMVGHRPNNQIAATKKVSEEVIDGEIIRLLQTSVTSLRYK